MNAAHISIIGIGKLDLCFALNLEAKGYHDVGIEAATQAIRARQHCGLNTPTWGFADAKLPEYSFHPPTPTRS